MSTSVATGRHQPVRLAFPRSLVARIGIGLASFAASVALMWWLVGLDVAFLFNASLAFQLFGLVVFFAVERAHSGVLVIPFAGTLTYSEEDETEETSQGYYFIAAFVGPAVSLFVTVYSLLYAIKPGPQSLGLGFASVNALILLVTLLPIPAFPGGLALKAIFAGAGEKTRRLVAFIGLAVGLAVISVLLSMHVWPFMCLLLLFIGFYRRPDDTREPAHPDLMSTRAAVICFAVYLLVLGIAAATLLAVGPWTNYY